jgi:fibronectin-binding autotransporter adhesin
MKKLSYMIIAALMAVAGVAQAANVTNVWDGGGTDGNWGNKTNWVGDAFTINSTDHIVFTGSVNTNTFTGAGRNVSSLSFDDNADSNFGIEMAATPGGTNAPIAFYNAAAINVATGSTATIRFFGAGNMSINSNASNPLANGTGMVINHSGTGDLRIEKGISGAAFDVTKNGTGTLTMAPSAANAFTGFKLNDGKVRIGGSQAATALGALAGTVTLNGGTLSSDSAALRTVAQALVFGGDVTLGNATDTGGLTFTGNVNLGGAVRTIKTDSNVTLGGVIDNGGLTKAGTGNMAITNANTYAGATTVKAGLLMVSHSSALGTTAGGTSVSNGASLRLEGNINTAENFNIAGAGYGAVVGALRNFTGTTNTVSGLVTLDANATIAGDGKLTLSGGVANNKVLSHSGTVALVADSAITGSGSILKNGTGDLTLNALNTYTGNTTVNNAGSNLLLTDDAGLTFVIGENGVNNKLTGTGAAVLDGDFYFNLTSAGTTVGDSWTIASVSNQTFSSTFTVDGFTDAGSDKWTKAIAGSKFYEFSEGTGVLTVIPEPATIGMLGLGAIITLMLRRMRTR